MLPIALLLLVLGGPTPKRIVSTSPSITETLFALDLGDRVVGVSRYCRYPAETAAIPRVGTFLKPDAELVVRLSPDLVFVHAGPSGIEQRLSSLGIRFIAVERDTLASIFETVRVIGEAAGARERAAALVVSLEERLERVRAAVSKRPKPRVLLIVGRRAGALTDLVAAGRNSYLSDLVAIAGGVNVLSEEGIPAYPRISMETVIRLEPDVIIDAGDMGDRPEERERRRAATVALWRDKALPAAKAGRVYAVISDALVIPGPRIVEAAETVAKWLHGVKVP